MANEIELTGSNITSNSMTLTGSIEAQVIIGYTKWGKIEGSLDDQTDLKEALDAKDTALQEEVTRAAEAETQLATLISNEALTRASNDTTLSNNLSSEESRAKEAENALETKVTNETTRAKEVESNLAKALSQEVTTRGNNDKALETSISEETTRATKAENSLSTNLNSEISRAVESENAIKTDLGTEVSRAKEVENEKVDKVEGKSLLSDTEITRLGTLHNYDDTEVKEDIAKCSLITETGNKIDLELDSKTYVLTAKMYDKNNNLLSTSTQIDLPLETLVLNVEYDKDKKAIIITLKDGTTKEVPVGDLISGLVSETTFNEYKATVYTKSEVDKLISDAIAEALGDYTYLIINK